MTPIIKWAGGKTVVLPKIIDLIPDSEAFDTYVEPFIGGGAVFLWALENRPNFKRFIINDLNENLYNLYTIMRDKPEEFLVEIDHLENAFNFSRDKQEVYTALRNEYNASLGAQNVRMAALFVALNKTCFNGLYRVNGSGQFNVPFNHTKRDNLVFVDRDNFEKISGAMQNVEVMNVSFEKIDFKLKNAFYYVDPPYRPVKDDSFVDYTKESFGDIQQILLKNKLDAVHKSKSLFVLSNSYTDDGFFENLYKKYELDIINVPRRINSKGDARGEVKEILVHNDLKKKSAKVIKQESGLF